MKKRNFFTFTITILAALFLIACSGGGGGSGTTPTGATDSDSDGIPNSQDAFPDDATQFASLTEVTLGRIAGTPTFSAAVAVNNSDQAVGTSDSGTDVQAVMWNTGTGTVTPLQSLAGEAFAAALDINDAGDVVGISAKNSGANFVAVTWPAGNIGLPNELNNLAGGSDSAAHAIDDSGRIVGEAKDAGGIDRAVIWPSAGSGPNLLTDTIGATTSSASAIEAGFTVGQATDAAGAKHAVLWLIDAAGNQTGFTDLGTAGALGGTEAIALSVNAGGRIVGEYEDGTGVAHAVEWIVDGAGALLSGPTDLADTLVESSGLAVNGASDARGAGWAEDSASGNLTAFIADFRFTDIGQAIFDPAAVLFSQAYDINDSDLVVGIRQTASGNEAFLVVPQ